jgi:hypothetical protein
LRLRRPFHRGKIRKHRWAEAELAGRAQGEKKKLKIALRLRAETTMSL